MKRFALISIFALSAPFVCISCEDPSVARREDAERRIRDGGANVVLAARRASIDRIVAAEELRNAGRALENIAGASTAQAQAAAGIAANAMTQAALLEIGRADQLESENRASRTLALGYLRVVDEIHSLVKARELKGLNEAKGALEVGIEAASISERDQLAQQTTLEATVSSLRAANQAALADAQAILIEAEVIRLQGSSAALGEMAAIAEDAGRKRDEAGIRQTEAEESDLAAITQESILRLKLGETVGATRRVQVLRAALVALDQLEGDQKSVATAEIAIANTISTTIVELVAASSPTADDIMKGCQERAFTDLQSAESFARESGPQSSAMISIASARARAQLGRGEGEFQQALIYHVLASSPSMQGDFENQSKEWLAKAQASTKEALESYAALQEVLAGSGEESLSKQALVLTVERALKSIRVPSLEMLPAIPPPPPVDVATDATRPSSDKPTNKPAPIASPAASAGGPPFATAEDLAAFFGSSKRDPKTSAQIDKLIIAKTPEGQSLSSTAFGAVKAIGQLQVAMQEKFGKSNLGPLSALVNQGATASVTESTADNATISVGNAQGSLLFKAARTDEGWKLDLDATATTMDEAQRGQMAAAGAMMGTLIDGLTGITAQIESGEMKSPQEVQGALMLAMRKLMGG